MRLMEHTDDQTERQTTRTTFSLHFNCSQLVQNNVLVTDGLSHSSHAHLSLPFVVSGGVPL
jgi:hypothetical protein